MTNYFHMDISSTRFLGATMRFEPESSDAANAGLEKARYAYNIYHLCLPDVMSCVISYVLTWLLLLVAFPLIDTHPEYSSSQSRISIHGYHMLICGHWHPV